MNEGGKEKLSKCLAQKEKMLQILLFLIILCSSLDVARYGTFLFREDYRVSQLSALMMYDSAIIHANWQNLWKIFDRIIGLESSRVIGKVRRLYS